MDKKTFPFKTLIWAVVVLTVLFLFKPEIARTIVNSQEIDVFGVKIKVSEQQSEELLIAQTEFEAQAKDLNAKIQKQEVAMDSLNLLAVNLSGQIQGCQDAQNTSKKIDSSLKSLNALNSNIKRQPLLLKDYQIIKMSKQN
nr:hypothetical protein [uncultured Allomuricauda sp.]